MKVLGFDSPSLADLLVRGMIRQTWPKTGGLYCIRLSKTHYYIGRAVSFRERWIKHLNRLCRGNHDNPYFQNVYNKYMLFEPEVLLEVDANVDLQELEQNLLNEHFGQLGCLNLSRTAEGIMVGRKHSEETKDKMRKTHATYEYRHNMSMVKQGTKRTPDAIAKTSAANRGKKRPLEAITATALANTGKHPTAETLVRLSESHKGLVSGMKGKKHSEETKEKIRNKIRLLLSEKKTGDLPHKENKGVL